MGFEEAARDLKKGFGDFKESIWRLEARVINFRVWGTIYVQKLEDLELG